MLTTTLGAADDTPLTILCLGAHSDDIEIGCGGTMLRILRERPGSTVHWVVFSAEGYRATEARASSAAFTERAAAVHVTIHAFRESYFPYEGAAIKEMFSTLAAEVEPDLVFTHVRDDEHQDHRTIGMLTWNHFRDHVVFEYEIPKYEGDTARPNVYAPLTRDLAEEKIGLLLENFGSQRVRPWFRAETFRGSMAIRGIECNAPQGYAEAFQARKLRV